MQERGAGRGVLSIRGGMCGASAAARTHHVHQQVVLELHAGSRLRQLLGARRLHLKRLPRARQLIAQPLHLRRQLVARRVRRRVGQLRQRARG